MTTNSCACDTGSCNCKPATKVIGDRNALHMFSNGKGVSFSLSIITSMVAAKLGKTFGEFTVYEDTYGNLIINTGLTRNEPYEESIGCQNQPCSGECEGCPASVL